MGTFKCHGANYMTKDKFITLFFLFHSFSEITCVQHFSSLLHRSQAIVSVGNDTTNKFLTTDYKMVRVR